MSLSQRQIDSLVELVDIELKVLDAYPDEDGPNNRIPQLEACRLELITLAAAERARRKKAFPALSWKIGKSRDTGAQPRPAEIPDPPGKSRVTGGVNILWRRQD